MSNYHRDYEAPSHRPAQGNGSGLHITERVNKVQK